MYLLYKKYHHKYQSFTQLGGYNKRKKKDTEINSFRLHNFQINTDNLGTKIINHLPGEIKSIPHIISFTKKLAGKKSFYSLKKYFAEAGGDGGAAGWGDKLSRKIGT